MTHSVAPVLEEIAMKYFVILGRDTVLDSTCIRKSNLLIPTLLANRHFALEWIHSCQSNIESRQGQ